jgi:hypothetical protein
MPGINFRKKPQESPLRQMIWPPSAGGGVLGGTPSPVADGFVRDRQVDTPPRAHAHFAIRSVTPPDTLRSPAAQQNVHPPPSFHLSLRQLTPSSLSPPHSPLLLLSPSPSSLPFWRPNQQSSSHSCQWVGRGIPQTLNPLLSAPSTPDTLNLQPSGASNLEPSSALNPKSKIFNPQANPRSKKKHLEP